MLPDSDPAPPEEMAVPEDLTFGAERDLEVIPTWPAVRESESQRTAAYELLFDYSLQSELIPGQ